MSSNLHLYNSKDFIGSFLRESRTRAVLKHIKGKLLDVACGDNRLVKFYKNGIGVDIKQYNDNIVLENYYNLPFKSKTFETITIIASLKYFENHEVVINELSRVLKDNGIIIITNSNYFAMLIWSRIRDKWKCHNNYKDKEIIKLFNKSYFQIILKEKYLFNLSSILIFRKSN